MYVSSLKERCSVETNQDLGLTIYASVWGNWPQQGYKYGVYYQCIGACFVPKNAIECVLIEG